MLRTYSKLSNLVLVTTVLAVGVGIFLYLISDYRHITTETDHRKPFVVNPSNPFEVQLGRGSGWDGLETIKINEQGLVLLHRHSGPTHGWEHAMLRLPQNRLVEILDQIEARELMKLHRTYHDTRVQDGTQWVLWIRQGDHEKSVYFNNNFPQSIINFANDLDQILDSEGRQSVVWKRVPEDQTRAHEKSLWESIR